MTLHLLDASEIQIQRISSFSIAIQREKGKMTGNNLMVIIIVGGGGAYRYRHHHHNQYVLWRFSSSSIGPFF